MIGMERGPQHPAIVQAREFIGTLERKDQVAQAMVAWHVLKLLEPHVGVGTQPFAGRHRPGQLLRPVKMLLRSLSRRVWYRSHG